MKYLLRMIVGFIVLGLCLIGSINAQPPRVGKISDQTLILIMHVNGKSATVKQAFLKPIPFYDKSNPDNSYYYTLLSRDNKELYSGSFPNPLERWVDDFSEPGNPRGGKETIVENEFMLKVPYFKTATKLKCEHEFKSKTVSLGVSVLRAPTQ